VRMVKKRYNTQFSITRGGGLPALLTSCSRPLKSLIRSMRIFRVAPAPERAPAMLRSISVGSQSLDTASHMTPLEGRLPPGPASVCTPSSSPPRLAGEVETPLFTTGIVFLPLDSIPWSPTLAPAVSIPRLRTCGSEAGASLNFGPVEISPGSWAAPEGTTGTSRNSGLNGSDSVVISRQSLHSK
jgi:hypothetical protein